MIYVMLILVLVAWGPVSAGAQAVQHGAQPNPQEVRPGSPDGDSPSAATGTLERERAAREILGLPVNAVLVIGGVLVALLVIGGLAIPSARRRARAQGGGTYGRPR